MGRELFAAGFVSCWAHLNDAYQQQLVRSLEMAFSSPNIPPEILGTLLNLVGLALFCSRKVCGWWYLVVILVFYPGRVYGT